MQQLVREFREVVGLTELDAYRSAYCAEAHSLGWSNARIGRLLGTTRARVGQRIEKLHHYADTHEMPCLQRTLDAVPSERDRRLMRKLEQEVPLIQLVGFSRADWLDREFRQGMLQLTT